MYLSGGHIDDGEAMQVWRSTWELSARLNFAVNLKLLKKIVLSMKKWLTAKIDISFWWNMK